MPRIVIPDDEPAVVSVSAAYARLDPTDVRQPIVRRRQDAHAASQVPRAAGVVAVASPATAGLPEIKPTIAMALNFIVGNEHIEVTVKIEIVRFAF